MNSKPHNPYYGQTYFVGVYTGNPRLPLPVMNVQFRLGMRLMYVYNGTPYPAFVDRITARGNWIAILRESDGKHFYQKLTATDEVYIAPSWLVFPAFDMETVKRMRGDQVNPEVDVEFVRVEYSGVTK